MIHALNPLRSLLADPNLTELMWNDFAKCFAEQEGRLAQIDSPLKSEREYMELIDYLCSLTSHEGVPSLHFDGMLPDGSRFHVTRPPLSPNGPTLTIRKFSPMHYGIDNLLRHGFITEKAAVFLKACVRARLNLLISGATGAGKTTLLNALTAHAHPGERIITVEDAPEIQLTHCNWIRLVANRDEPGASVRDCLIGCLRMRPDRIIVGECRSSETLEMLQIMNTGHDGGMSTLHANSSSDALTRLESLILFHAGAEIPIRALRRQIVDAIDLVIHVGKDPNGQRHVEEILEVVGMEGDVITRMSIFKRSGSKDQFKLLATGNVPTFRARLEERGTSLPSGFFDPSTFEIYPGGAAA